jgi:ParB family chromosome partitioning protein
MTATKRKNGFVNVTELMAQVKANGGGVQAAALQEPAEDVAAPGAQKLDPATIWPSRWANRHADSFTGPEFAALKAEIESAGGNVQPIKVRPVAGGFEVVFGHRRHRACAELGLQVLAVVEALDDAQLFTQMERENRGRAALSAWEQGTMYRRALDEGLFPSNRRLAEAVGVDVSAIGKALRIARLPAEVVEAFPSPTAIRFRWGQGLAEALERSETTVLAEARRLADMRLSAPEVFARLEAAATAEKDGGRTVLPPTAVAPPKRLDLGAGRHVDVRAKGERVTLELDAALLPPDAWTALEKALRKIAGGKA